MSEQEAESADGQNENEGLGDLQESRLDSVTGGASPRKPHMDLQETQHDTIRKDDSSGGRETKEAGEGDRDTAEDGS
ncbi:hypothetical protein [Nocardioides sp. Leaf307]|uniref:hypothetical protein n=1 Tax=Nocardioides sp. Leaf307 TaxID=1736331 RepID=UPI000702598F|nr:hypothetical protein [Nocardioides sp. Leaf307]KQQ42132.1 hypothetical protein ASF50_14945 [Nocardioides sp. Leaf307]